MVGRLLFVKIMLGVVAEGSKQNKFILGVTN